MADTVQTAIYQMGLDPSAYTRAAGEVAQSNEKIVQSTARVTEQEERLDRTTRTTADGFAKLEARYDPLIKLELQRQRAIQQATRYLDEGSVSQERYGAQIARVNAFYDQQAAALGRLNAASRAQVAGINAAAAASNAHAGAVRLQSYQIANLGQQIQDVVVQLSTGTNPFVVLLQQGPQAAYAVGGVTAAFQLLGSVIRAHPILAAAATIATVAAGYLALRDNTDEAATAQIRYEDAMRRSVELMESAEEKAHRLAEEKRKEADETIRSALATEQETVSRAQAALQRTRETLSRLEAAQASGRDMGDSIGRARSTVEGLEAILRQAVGRVADLQDQLVRVSEWSETGGKKVTETFAATRDTIESYIASLRAENEILGLSNREKEIRQKLDEAINLAMKEGNLLLPEQTQAIRDAVNAKYDYIDATERQKKADKEAQEAAKRAADEQKRAAEKYARDIERTTDRISDNLSRSLGDTFFAELNGESENFWEGFEQAGKRAFANLLAEATVNAFFRPAINSVVSSFPTFFGIQAPGGGARPSGGIGLPSFGGAGSFFNPLSIMMGDEGGFGLGGISNLFSLSSLAQGGGLLSPLTGLGGAAAGLLGFSVAGPSTMAAAASLATGPGGLLAGGGATSLAAAPGAMLSPLAATGIGAAIAGAAILAISLLGKDKQYPFAEAEVGQGKVFGIDNLDEGPVDKIVQLANSANTATKQFAQLLGVNVNSLGAYSIGFNQGRGGLPDGFYTVTGGGGFGAPGAISAANENQATADLIRRQFLDSPELSATMRTVFGNRFGDLEALGKAVDFGKLFDDLTDGKDALNEFQQAMKAVVQQLHDGTEQATKLGLDPNAFGLGLMQQFNKDIAAQIKAITDPMGAALDEFEKNAKARLDTAKALGADIVRVEKLNALQRKQIVDQFTQGVIAQAQAQANTLRAYLDQQRLGALSSLSPEGRLSEAERQFNASLAAVRGGTADVSAATGAADALLRESSNVFGRATQPYVTREAFVRSTLESLGADLKLPGFVTKSPDVVTALAQAVQVLGGKQDATNAAIDNLRKVIEKAGLLKLIDPKAA